MPRHFRLISHKLCPYVQRAVIVACEKGIPFERVDIDLASKPDWFLAISPTGKVPVLEVTEIDGTRSILFESAVVAEYLDEICGRRMLPADPMERARQRAWVEFASTALANISQLYSAPTAAAFEASRQLLDQRLLSLEAEIAGPWFGGSGFGLVDAAFGPVFRYIEIFERVTNPNIIRRPPKLAAWSKALSERPSIIGAVPADYEQQLLNFVAAKQSYLGKQLVELASLAA